MAFSPTSPVIVNTDGNLQQPSYRPALISLAVLYFMMGFITCLNDTLVPFFKKEFTLSYAGSSLVQFYFFLTYGIMSIPAGKLVEKLGYKKGMVAGFFIAAVGAFLFYPASVFHEYSIFLAALFVLAIGIVLLQVAANPYITVLGPASTASSRLTLIQGVGSIGTTIAPLFGAYFILSGVSSAANSSEAVRTPYIGIGLVLLVIAVAVFLLKLPEVKVETATSDKKQQGSVFSFRNLRLGIPAIFFYVGAEVAIGTFLTNYIADVLQVKEEAANGYVSFYWGGMLVGRLLGAYVLKLMKPSQVLAFCALSSIVLILISINSSGTLAIWAMIGVGLFNSIMFATIFSLSVNGLGSHTTRASGYLSSAIAGGAVVSYLQGMAIDHFSWSIAFLLPMICYAYILFYAINGYKHKS
ncbi:sugar MFS transporter [Flavihumibacter cheonanensis]|uniref:sugar MFS transporter n=1 Tax=Flavihumibacter cheonanensis TaxID=1442385 RepID=UPI001EF82E83|nr:sugar MFS transporter [Flavihumibacter cheonanensis]MCG7754551.1 sugar MFS transporter [Flavihumibacter cheonanensis]